MITTETREHILADFDRLLARTQKELEASNLEDLETLARFDLTAEALKESYLSQISDETSRLKCKLSTIQIAFEWFVEDSPFEHTSVDYQKRRQEGLRDRKGHSLETTHQRRIRAFKQGEIDGYTDVIRLFEPYVETA